MCTTLTCRAPCAIVEHMFDIHRRAPEHPAPTYAPAMAVSAHDVAAALRERLPGLPTKKLHKLLYYCQGHHLAMRGEPLFQESISAWDMGPVVGTLWFHEKQGADPAAAHPSLDESQLNTIGYVVSRYGALSGLDLEHLTHSEAPWQTANRDRRPGDSARIELDWLRDYFAGGVASDADDEETPLDSGAVSRWLRDAEARRAEPVRLDTRAAVEARLRASAE